MEREPSDLSLVPPREPVGMISIFGWEEVPADLDDISKHSLARAHRNKLLAESDFSQMTDVPMTDEKRAEWRTYRQQLRDLPAHEDWPNPPAPTRPEAN